MPGLLGLQVHRSGALRRLAGEPGRSYCGSMPVPMRRSMTVLIRQSAFQFSWGNSFVILIWQLPVWFLQRAVSMRLDRGPTMRILGGEREYNR